VPRQRHSPRNFPLEKERREALLEMFRKPNRDYGKKAPRELTRKAARQGRLVSVKPARSDGLECGPRWRWLEMALGSVPEPKTAGRWLRLDFLGYLSGSAGRPKTVSNSRRLRQRRDERVKARTRWFMHLYGTMPGRYRRNGSNKPIGRHMPLEKELVLCQARAEFTGLSEDEVWDAIESDNYGENPITGEVTRLGAEFLARFKGYADERGGSAAATVLRVAARCPIERVAILTLLRYVEFRRAGVRSSAFH